MPRKKVDISDLGINPFTFQLVVEVTDIVDMGKSTLVERNEYCKVFRSGYAKDMVMLLPPVACKLFLYIAQYILPGQDVIKINPEAFMSYAEVKSNKTYYNAIIDLQKACVLAPVAARRSTFWINPSILFCGSRIAKYPDNVVVKSTFNKK